MALRNAVQTLLGVGKCSGPLSECVQSRFYRAVQMKSFDEVPYVVDIRDEPKPSETQALVRVGAAGLNHADMMMMKGRAHTKIKLPFTPGFELAGEILAVGSEVANFKVGDRVLALKTNTTGAFAELCVAEENELYAIPYSMTYEMAASLPVGYGTALHTLQDIVGCREKQYVLVITAQGSKGIAAIDIALNVFKCNVLVASDSEKKLAVVRPSGVLATIELGDENMQNILRKYCDANGGVDVIIDTVGGHWVKEAFQCLKSGGHICSLGFSSGVVPDINLLELVGKSATVSGISLSSYAHEYPYKFHDLIGEVIQYYDDKFISPLKAHTVKLDQFHDALDFVNYKKALGKVVVGI